MSFLCRRWLCLLLVCCVSLPRQATATPLVFCHYMLYSFLYSDDVAGLSKEIQLAQQHGIDAFALNTGVWNDIYQTRADNFYTVAANLNFKLFFSADMSGSLTLDNLRTMLTRYGNYTSQLRYQGKQFFSTFAGRTVSISPYTDPLSTWRDGVFSPSGNNIFFVPFFETNGSQDDITSVINEFNPILDGLFAWDTSAWPYLNGDYTTPSDAADRAYLAACGAAGKVYMASVSPWFYRPDLGIKGDYAGDGLWRTHWEQLIALQPQFIEIVTWNDWAERTYVVSVSSENTPYGASENNDLSYPHQPFLDLASSYYIPWFKAGQNQEPIITQELLYIYYYVQSKNGSTVPNAAVLQDRLYATVTLMKAGDVTLMSGSTSMVFSNVQAGVQSVSMPFSEGQQSASMARNGVQVLEVSGALPIVSSSSSPDFNVYSIHT